MASQGDPERAELDLLVRVYVGGFSAPQIVPFIAANSSFGKQLHLSGLTDRNARIKIEYKYVSSMRADSWSPFDLVNWLLGSDLHFVLTHPHQGNPRWNCCEVIEAFQALRTHAGFPHGFFFDCAIFTQHKFHYLTGVKEIVNPTIAIPLPHMSREIDEHGNLNFVSFSSSQVFDSDKLRLFLETNNEGKGWVVKFPFVTVREGLTFCKTIEQVLHTLDVAVGKFGGRIPYAMIQAHLLNRREYKVVVLNGKASHVLPRSANGISASGKAFSTAPHCKLFQFAEMAVFLLSRRCPGSQSHGLVRVDIMETVHGNMIVNEFESLEARFDSTCSVTAHNTESFLMSFWMREIEKAIGVWMSRE